MYIWTVEDSKLVLYQRSGKCNMCAQCCCKNVITCQMEVGFKPGKREDEGEDDYDWSTREGWHIFMAQGIWWYFKVSISDEMQKKPCEALVDGKCSIWQGDDFSPLCRYWPFHPSNVERFAGCGFTFERVDTDTEVEEGEMKGL